MSRMSRNPIAAVVGFALCVLGTLLILVGTLTTWHGLVVLRDGRAAAEETHMIATGIAAEADRCVDLASDFLLASFGPWWTRSYVPAPLVEGE